MIVVTNTSPLTNLAAIGQFELLRRLFTTVHIPRGVWNELNAGERRWPGHDQVAAADWVEQHAVHDQALVTALRRDLDRGEAESIALALELGADLVLMDEREGRRAAQRLGLQLGLPQHCPYANASPILTRGLKRGKICLVNAYRNRFHGLWAALRSGQAFSHRPLSFYSLSRSTAFSTNVCLCIVV